MSTGNPALVHPASATKHVSQVKSLENFAQDVSNVWLPPTTHPVENIHPALEGDTLEGCQHCQHKVVKVGDPKVRANPVLPADLSPGLVTQEPPSTRPAVHQLLQRYCMYSFSYF